MDPEDDVVTQIQALVSGLTRGTNLFRGPVRGYSDNIPHQAVFVIETGGLLTRPIKAGVLDRVIQERHVSVQIRVRSNPTGSSTALVDGRTIAKDVFDALHFNPPDGYCEWRFVSSAPMYLGEDENQHHEWSMNLETIFDV